MELLATSIWNYRKSLSIPGYIWIRIIKQYITEKYEYPLHNPDYAVTYSFLLNEIPVIRLRYNFDALDHFVSGV